MNFSKVIQLSQSAKGYQQIKLTNAQIEEIEKSGRRAIPEKIIGDFFHISMIRSEEVLMEKDSEELTDISEDTSRELRAGGPVFFVISVKDGELSTELISFYTGMIMATMQLQITDLLLGYSFSAPQEKLRLLNMPEWKNRLDVPRDYSVVQILKVGYPDEPVNKRVPYLGSLLSRILD
ncbi:hypothetical protein LZ578_10920 [Jeotgalibaca sp. MA1X17-3]|uniref:hypothetical protein n=1 Tax=Jeotgalibaca sp. MA1X17-3 TaxID=2908211 RepID=UPI001F25ABEE|nr:hypothetical protein [Jeotgalibaca sp. MA1X17-3]UJF15465.1 hypothetical protein LZ578_10920 [Jeotgalibaca sp. MA1X17-3]